MKVLTCTDRNPSKGVMFKYLGTIKSISYVDPNISGPLINAYHGIS